MLRFGVLGAGRIGKVHARTIAASGMARVAYLADALPKAAAELAARLDGVNAFKLFRFITVPSIRPSLIVVLSTISITTLKVFDIVRTSTGGQFGTSVLANEFYFQTFRASNRGLGAALATLIFILVTPIVVYNVRQMRKLEAR